MKVAIKTMNFTRSAREIALRPSDIFPSSDCCLLDAITNDAGKCFQKPLHFCQFLIGPSGAEGTSVIIMRNRTGLWAREQMMIIQGTNDNDAMIGTADADTIFGAYGSDTINGQPGNDLIYGEDGNDNLDGNLGNGFNQLDR